jgi:N-acetyl sugar amidotransferase
LKHCTKCLLPETHETITFDIEGVCSVCNNHGKKQVVDWSQRKKELDLIVADVKKRNASYDCIIPFSGGKDSTWSLYYAVKELGLKVLVVSFDHGFYRNQLIENRNRTLDSLGVDFLIFKPNQKLVKKLMIQSLKDKGDFCWHCHTGISSYPLHIAGEKEIPLVLWGESSTEYTNYFKVEDFHTIDSETYNRIANLGISAEDMYYRLNEEFELREFLPFTIPSLASLQAKKIATFPLGNYIKWDTQKQVEIIESELGWKGDEVEGVPPEYRYEKIECMMQGMRDFLKYSKRGYARTTHLTSIDIRNGKMSREEALEKVSEYEGKRPYSLELFLDFLDLPEEELISILSTQVVDPWNGKVPLTIGKRPKDYDDWARKILHKE